MLGSQANAYFYIAFTVVTAFNLLFVNVSTSLMVEGVIDERRLAALTRQVARRFLLWLVLGGVVLYAAAPLILAPFGPEYATGAVAVLVPMLRLLRTPGDTPRAWSSEPVPLLAATAVAAGDR